MSTTTSTNKAPLQSICHCGAITITLSRLPTHVNECQCTICRRYAAAWGYFRSNELQFEQKGAGTKKYVWGDADNEFHFCDHCGCVVYWWAIAPEEDDGTHRVGINTRNMKPSDIAFVERRIQFDANEIPLKDPTTKHREDTAVYV